MSEYFLKRADKVRGPFSSEQITAAVQAGKIKIADSISVSENGPWGPVIENCQSCGAMLDSADMMISGRCANCGQESSQRDSLDVSDASSVPRFAATAEEAKRNVRHSGPYGELKYPHVGAYTVMDFLIPQKMLKIPTSTYVAKDFPALTFAMQIYVQFGKILYSLCVIALGCLVIWGAYFALSNYLIGQYLLFLCLCILILLLLNTALAGVLGSVELILIFTRMEKHLRRKN